MPEHIQTEYVHHTDNALCVKDLHGNDAWVPMSTIDYIEQEPDTLERGDPISFECRTWIAEEKELI